MQFFAIRYLLVEENQQLFPIADGKNIQDVFLDQFNSKSIIKHYSKQHLIYPLGTDVGNNFQLGYFLKSTETQLIELTGSTIEESDLPNWERLVYLLDRTHQILIFEHKSGIATHENIQKIIFELCGKTINSAGYKLELDFIADDKSFWKVIEDAEDIYEIGFELKAPNLFDGWIEANDMMQRLKDIFNNTTALFKVNNDSGRLTAKKENLDGYRQLADSGGGTWFIRAKLKGRRVVSRYTKEMNLRKERLSDLGTAPTYIMNNVAEVIGRLQSVIDKFREIK